MYVAAFGVKGHQTINAGYEASRDYDKLERMELTYSPVRERRPDIVARLCMVVDWCIDHPEYTAKIKVIPKKDYPILMPCEF